MTSSARDDSSIKTMKLYSHYERVDNELKAAGHKDGSPLKPNDLYAFDHMVLADSFLTFRSLYITIMIIVHYHNDTYLLTFLFACLLV